MPEEPQEPNPQTGPLNAGQNPFLTSFSEQLVNKGLSNEPRDRVLVELGAEIDRLEELLTETRIKQTVKVTASHRRADMLVKLYTMIKDREQVDSEEGTVSIIASMIRLLQDVLDEMNMQKEVKQTVVQNLLMKLEQEAAERATAKRQRGN